MSFWDIDNFLAEEQKIICSFSKQAAGMQFLDPTKGHGGDVDANEEIEAPIWVLNILNDYMPEIQEKGYLKVKFPAYLHSKQFQNRVNSFEISTRNSSMQKLNFQKQSPYFYQTYTCLTKLMSHQKVPYDKKLLGKYLDIRGKYILIRASNYVGSTNIDMSLSTYTDFQMSIYKKTKRIMEECNAWKYSHKWLDKHNILKKNTIK